MEMKDDVCVDGDDTFGDEDDTFVDGDGDDTCR